MINLKYPFWDIKGLILFSNVDFEYILVSCGFSKLHFRPCGLKKLWGLNLQIGRNMIQLSIFLKK